MRDGFVVNNAMWNRASVVGVIVLVLWDFVYFYKLHMTFGFPALVESVFDVVLGLFVPVTVGASFYIFACWLIWKKKQRKSGTNKSLAP